MKNIFILLLALSSSLSFAQSGADLLMQSSGMAPAPGTPANTAVMNTNMKLSDPFLQTLFLEWQESSTKTFELNRWVTLVLANDFKQAAHLWSSLKDSGVDGFRPQLAATWAYLNWKLNLPQGFMDAWRESYSLNNTTRMGSALEQTILPGFATWMSNSKPFIDPSWMSELATATSGVPLEIAAWAYRGDAAKAAEFLPKLPFGHPLAIQLSQIIVTSQAKTMQLGEAGKLMKYRLEPELQKLGNPEVLSRYYLTLGRLLYQAGSLEAAEAFYSRIPRGSQDFLAARSERAWVLLRLGKVSELRGELASLSHKVLQDRFMPEVLLVRSISNLKLCEYDNVAQDFKDFIDTNKGWAKSITKALASPIIPDPQEKDARIEMAKAGLKVLETEENQLKKLAHESIKAALPAVGEQAHWKDALARVAVIKEQKRQELEGEKRRFWKNREIVLTEAIRKMKFVKIEAMSQIRMAQDTTSGEDLVQNVQAGKDKQSYPFDGVYWPDELFKLHAKAYTRCAVGAKK